MTSVASLDEQGAEGCNLDILGRSWQPIQSTKHHPNYVFLLVQFATPRSSTWPPSTPKVPLPPRRPSKPFPVRRIWGNPHVRQNETIQNGLHLGMGTSVFFFVPGKAPNRIRKKNPKHFCQEISSVTATVERTLLEIPKITPTGATTERCFLERCKTQPPKPTKHLSTALICFADAPGYLPNTQQLNPYCERPCRRKTQNTFIRF